MAIATMGSMTSIPAGKFKDICLKTLDDVARTRTTVVITKRGRPIARLVPCPIEEPASSLAGSVLQETGNPFGTGETWNADPA
jgi:antitoxin (DNA-binding transcriptional repressor) of toxin-antitoxin stability system